MASSLSLPSLSLSLSFSADPCVGPCHYVTRFLSHSLAPCSIAFFPFALARGDDCFFFFLLFLTTHILSLLVDPRDAFPLYNIFYKSFLTVPFPLRRAHAKARTRSSLNPVCVRERKINSAIYVQPTTEQTFFVI